MKKLILLLALLSLLIGVNSQAQYIIMKGVCRGTLKGAELTVQKRDRSILIIDDLSGEMWQINYGKFLGQKVITVYAASYTEPDVDCPFDIDYFEWFGIGNSDGRHDILQAWMKLTTNYSELSAYDCVLCRLDGQLKVINLFTNGEDDFAPWPKVLKGCCIFDLIPEAPPLGGDLTCTFRYNQRLTKFFNTDLGTYSSLSDVVDYLVGQLVDDKGYTVIGWPGI